MAASNFVLLFFSITTRFYPPKDIIFEETTTRTEDLGLYSSTNTHLLPYIDFILCIMLSTKAEV